VPKGVLALKIKNIFREKGTEVVTIEQDETIQEAIRKLNEHRIGALVVADERGEVCGIITERDILRQYGQRCVAVSEPSRREETRRPSLVREIMTKDLIIGVPDDSLDYVMGIMTTNRIRHLPVMDGKKLVGIVSIGDVVNAHLEKTEFENRMLKDYIHGVTL
jgi:CBS domain-containing protein